jgi:hypothetical protein
LQVSCSSNLQNPAFLHRDKAYATLTEPKCPKLQI